MFELYIQIFIIISTRKIKVKHANLNKDDVFKQI